MHLFPRRILPLLLCCTLGLLALLPAEAAVPSGAKGPVTLHIALYFAPAPKTDPQKALAGLIEKGGPELTPAGVSAKADDITVGSDWVPLADYAPLPPESYRYFAIGVSPDLAEPISRSQRVLVLHFSAPGSKALRANQLACTLVYELANATGGLPWDEECRLLYAAEDWKQLRVDTWQGTLPDMRTQVTMHAYRNPTLVRLITLGMKKFGLPDLCITEVPSSHTRSAGNLINACLQSLAEGNWPEQGRFTLVLAELRHDKARASALENPLDKATGRLVLSFRNTPLEEGDPNNRLWTPDFPDFKAASLTERLVLATASLYGSEETVQKSDKNDPEMKAARERAHREFMAKLPSLQRPFDPNERLIVKAPFIVDEGTEYMWVEVLHLKKGSLEGVLINDSIYDSRLRAGQRTTVRYEDVYDYLHYKPDGTEEGNETGKLLERREK
jgi:uncharacterized protein YegJ (DUF2314 family)